MLNASNYQHISSMLRRIIIKFCTSTMDREFVGVSGCERERERYRARRSKGVHREREIDGGIMVRR